MRRRDFLVSGAALLMLPAARALGAETLKDRSGRPLKVGVQLYSVREECAKDLPGVLNAIAKMGYTGVEFAGYHGRTAKALRQLLEESKLQCYGTHVDLNALVGDNLGKTAAFCKELGCKLVVVPWIPEERRNSKAATLETAKLFNEIADKLGGEGLTFAWHNENYEFKPQDGETIWDTMTANTHRNVALQFDTGNALSAGVQAAPLLIRYPNRILSVHLKDFSATNRNALLGEGDEHWSEVLPILRNKTAARWFIVEQESYGDPPLVCIEKCLRNFEKMWTAEAAK